MKKNVIVILDDYWHPKASIEPLIDLLFPETLWNLIVTTNPNELLNCKSAPDLFVTFKDPIENDQIPTPIWCDDDWSKVIKKDIINDGMGFLAVHCGLTDLPEDHMITKDILYAHFVSHPPFCEVTFIPEKMHPITNGIDKFIFPTGDEHYIIDMIPDSPTEILGYTVSQNGRQPALWAHELGNGKVCGVTPGHNTENLTCPQYLKLLQNAIEWCTRKL
ncbi:ThuA domain-containing protein [Inconstantimicrobium mannanitabidum]|uniref:Uncharacterized protein n=1 Tax=Inconstantimicrobium mannanitabidum TaxID=1604901 RepID=A0ACB5RGI6_9CLOT|nr:ThuA domain-containing protein [Clostridium sp. TW13]GKX68206.1 hypothetical protein rsdtw13_34640 [Clostridium sp. TW13]